jgi:hypothetical protein
MAKNKKGPSPVKQTTAVADQVAAGAQPQGPEEVGGEVGPDLGKLEQSTRRVLQEVVEMEFPEGHPILDAFGSAWHHQTRGDHKGKVVGFSLQGRYITIRPE